MNDSSRVTRISLLAALLLGASQNVAAAQDETFYYPRPPAGRVAVTPNRQYGVADTSTLLMDVFRPATSNAPAPALIFFNVAVGAQRANPFYAAWANAAAANGLVAIVPDLRSGHADQDFRALIAHLLDHAADFGIDRDAIAVYAGSGNVYTALPVVEDPTLTAVKAAVMYYGTAPIADFRRDLPLMFVRAGLDRPGVNAAAGNGIIALASRAFAQNAPVTLLNDPGGHHAFEMFDDDDATRDVIDRTIDFIKRATAPAYQSALHHTLPEAAAAAYVVTGNVHAAAVAYRDLAAAHPNDSRLHLAYGESLLADGQFAAACAEFDPLRDKGLGKRDLGLPAAEACLRKGDPEAAIAWLRTIPKQFLPPSVQQEVRFTELRNRADFRALFDGGGAPTSPPVGAAPLLSTKGAFLALSVADMAASATWYSEKLGLAVVMRVPRTATPGVTVLEGAGFIVKLVERGEVLSGPT